MSSENLIVHQIVADFEQLARLTQRVIETIPRGDPRCAALLMAQDFAIHGALIARDALANAPQAQS